MQTTTADEFLDLACLTHAGNDAVRRRDQAEAILAASAGLMRDDTYVAAAVGNIRALREHLDRDADAATRRGGPRGWDALLYLCNGASRLARPGIRSRARASCSTVVRIRGRAASCIRCGTRPSRVPLASARRVRLRRRHTHRHARSSSFCSMRAPIRTTSRHFTTCTSCATRAGASCYSRGDFGSGCGSTICWVHR